MEAQPLFTASQKPWCLLRMSSIQWGWSICLNSPGSYHADLWGHVIGSNFPFLLLLFLLSSLINDTDELWTNDTGWWGFCVILIGSNKDIIRMWLFGLECGWSGIGWSRYKNHVYIIWCVLTMFCIFMILAVLIGIFCKLSWMPALQRWENCGIYIV